MTILKEHQFEILPSEEASDGFVFGIGADVSVDGEGGFDPGETEWLTQDTQNTRRGVKGFGRDVLGAKTWVWASHTDMDDVAGAVEVLEQFSTAWHPELVVREPGAQVGLRYQLAGRTRRVFGRPRRFAAPPTNLILSGYVPVTHDFQLVDSFTYDDQWSSLLVNYTSSSSGGGMILPATMPIITASSEGTGSDQASVGGTARAYPVIRFNGPWVNPVMDTGNWVLAWTGSIPNGGWVEIDCRPWKQSVLDHNGASAVGGLSRRTWLEDVYFAPSTRPEISLSGIATSGAASALVKWRNTYTSL